MISTVKGGASYRKPASSSEEPVIVPSWRELEVAAVEITLLLVDPRAVDGDAEVGVPGAAAALGPRGRELVDEHPEHAALRASAARRAVDEEPEPAEVQVHESVVEAGGEARGPHEHLSGRRPGR